MNNTRRTQEENIFNAENIRNCEKYVFSIQQRLDRAVATNNVRRIRHILDLLTKRSKAVKILAVYRITKQNQGKNTAGIDGIAIPKGDRVKALEISKTLLEEIDINAKPNTIKRAYIPKRNGKKRPLGIPTLKDRINQEILRRALEPIVEYYSHDHSFGFRPKRSCHDAIQLLYNKLGNRHRPRYIVEGDIKGCFDDISHKHVANTLTAWNVPHQYISLIDKMLKAKVFHNGEVYDNETGTPQGGVISPLLANVALTGLDNFIDENFGWDYSTGRVNPLVRYADDFVIVCESKQKAKEIKKAIKEYLNENIGLTLSEEKTKITHIHNGFNFLGFHIRKYKKYKNKNCNEPSDFKLLIKPQKEKVMKILESCYEVISECKSSKQKILISRLNPVLSGWANYYRYVVSSDTFCKIDDIIWQKLLNWGKRKHNNKRIDWIIQKYFTRLFNSRSLHFTDKEHGSSLTQTSRIFSKKRFVKVKNEQRVYCAEHSEYWKKRERDLTYFQLYRKGSRNAFEKQKGICPYCKGEISHKDVINTEAHLHHMLPRSFGGTDKYSNLRLLHKECHIELHQRLTRQEMCDIVKKMNLDYIHAKDELISIDSESRVR